MNPGQCEIWGCILPWGHKDDMHAYEDRGRYIAEEFRETLQRCRETGRHLAYVDVDLESVRRGGSCRMATCVCGWRGPERGTLELAVDDALLHERSDMEIVKR